MGTIFVAAIVAAAAGLAVRSIYKDKKAGKGCKKVGDFKEIYYEISRKDPAIGQATVYRMLLTLEEIGAIQRVQGYVVNESYEKAAV